MGVPRTVLLGAKRRSNPRRSKRQGARSTVLVLCPTTGAARCAGTASSTLLVENKRSTSLICGRPGGLLMNRAPRVSALRVSIPDALSQTAGEVCREPRRGGGSVERSARLGSRNGTRRARPLHRKRTGHPPRSVSVSTKVRAHSGFAHGVDRH